MTGAAAFSDSPWMPPPDSCPHCGHDRSVRAYDDTRDETDVEALRRQAVEAGGLYGDLIRNVAKRLEVEDTAAAELKTRLLRAYKAAMGEFRASLTGGSTSTETIRTAILSTTVEQLEALLAAAGLDVARDGLTERQAQILELNLRAAAKMGHPVALQELNQSALQAVFDSEAQRFWRDEIVRPSAVRIQQGLRRQVTIETLPDTIDRIQRELDLSVGRSANLARTRIGDFDRTVADEVAVAARLEYRLYLGALDNQTRPFCAALVGKVLSLDDIASLDNGQTSTSPLFSGGGFNCRHRWIAVPGPNVGSRTLEVAAPADLHRAMAPARARDKRWEA